ncbi:MAG: N-6 DNA methylase, partial [Candidatus Coproplasma sp.]
TDNFIGAETKEDMQHFARLQKQFAARDVSGGPNAIYPVLDIVDKHYELNGLIRESITEYAKELFGLDDSWNRKNASIDGFERIMDTLASFDLEENECDHSKGKFIVDELIKNIQLRSFGNRMVSEYLSRNELGEIAKGILQVQDGETFLDFTAGAGSTTFTIVNDKKCRVINCDILKDNTAIAAMLCIINGYENFTIRCEDTLSKTDFNLKADKIFVDAPIGLKVDNLDLGQKQESTLVAIYKTIQALNNNGIGMVTVNNSILFGSSKHQLEAKKNLVVNKYLKAVVSLPISMFGTLININFIIVSKQDNSNVLFINGNSKAFSKYVLKEKVRGTYLAKEGIELIISLVNNNQSIEEISRVVSYEEIETANFNLMPNTFVKEKMESESISLEEIDSELKKLYAQLGIK